VSSASFSTASRIGTESPRSLIFGVAGAVLIAAAVAVARR
jgi:hypothetical protein